MAINKDQIVEILKQCYDPEIPVDLWNLGLIYDIKINEKIVDITMSLTTPGCGISPSHEWIPSSHISIHPLRSFIQICTEPCTCYRKAGMKVNML